ncbi:TVP38/TMEM64 family membrane protein slr0305-like isoform X1 [Zingiber officinale]|uniref:TVP38/TMEM64 family membrane protein slr0305-like isoform X1 n=1 Tax=Zingiber officinale TaxID=94328 RepID=UPI001C4AD544|nr:TVP38/TMEM64 family membrane protein slr0305-like isoform X1 [Zingiber officinale]
MAVSWFSAVRITLLVLLAVATAAAFFTLPVEKILREFLVWIKQNLGLWGPAMLAVAYIPLTILAVPAAVLSLGGGYLFGLPIGFLADSIGATLGSVAAFLLGRTLGRPYVIAKMNDYPDFQAVAVAIERSGFKIVLLLRLAPLIPFCLLNYFLSVTPIGLAEYTMASWLGMMPITLVLVYVGTTLDDLADVTHGWSEASTAHWGTMVAGLVISAILMVCVTREAKAALQKALAENLEAEDILIMSPSPWLPSLLQPSSDLRQPLMIKIET